MDSQHSLSTKPLPRLAHKPWICLAQTAHENKWVSYDVHGGATLSYGGEKRYISQTHQYDLTASTMKGLQSRIVTGVYSPQMTEKETLAELFVQEYKKYTDARVQKPIAYDYGYYAYYPQHQHLVRFAPPKWHRIVAVASTSMLFRDKKKELSWQKIQQILQQTTVGVAGCSVGSHVIHNVVRDLRPCAIKIADKGEYKLENINRVYGGYWDLVYPQAHASEHKLKQKAETVAQQIYATDPFINIHTYTDGVHEKNIEQFFDGRGEEPALDIIVDEVDDPMTKYLLRVHARERRMPLLMVTDVGSAVQLDVMRYDQDHTLPLSHHASDAQLYQAVTQLDKTDTATAKRAAFFSFVQALIGTGYKQGEINDILHGQCEIPTSTQIPQMGSTVSVAGGIMAEAIARIRLGHKYPSHVLFNKHTFTISKGYIGTLFDS